MPSRRVRGLVAGALVVVLVIGITASEDGRAILNLLKNGTIQSLASPPPDRKYDAGRQSNLKAIYTALMLYHDSEDRWPAASGWMDAIENRLRTTDMPEAEAEKKLIRPDLPKSAGVYGYAMNDVASGKYKGDIKDPATPLVYESKDTARNAHGKPDLPKGLAITVTGAIATQR